MKNLFIDKLQTLVLCGMLFYNQVIILTAFSLIIVLYKLLIMGDYYFPVLINPSIGFEPTPLPYYWQRASITPKSNIYMAYLHNDGAINHRIVWSYQLWYRWKDSNLQINDSKSFAYAIRLHRHMVERSISPFIARFSPFPHYPSPN